MSPFCPTCAAVYTLTTADVGRRIACARCGTNLTVTPDGLRADPSATPPAKSVPRFRLPANWPTIAFTTGAVLVIFFVFMPLVGSANADRRTALLSEASVEHAANLKRLRERKADAKQISDAEEEWQRLRDQLQDEAKLAEAARARDLYSDRYGLLLGCVVLAVGAVGWTRADQPLTRRILGAVVLAAQLVLAFQTVTPLGCSPPGRSYNSGANPTP